MHHLISRVSRPFVATGLACSLIVGNTAFAADKPHKTKSHAVSNAELAEKLDALEAQNAELRAKVEKLEAAQTQQAVQVQHQAQQQQQQAAQVQQQEKQVQAVAQAQETATAAASTKGALASWAESTAVSSYGEIGYSRPTKAVDKANVDVARAVIGISHRFDDRTKMVGEWEWEHAITSSTDSGESEVEQLYVQRDFNIGISGKAGLFLMPVGLINQNHEPTAYYGVFRPDVDTKIVPSTWREVGLGMSGDSSSMGLSWDVGVTTGPNLSKWDPSSNEGRVRGPLAAIHGEGQFAAAREPSVYGAINWRGVPGLLVGGSVVTGNIGQHQPGFLGDNSRLWLLEGHARYQIDRLDVAGEFVRGSITNTEALNSSFAASSTPNPTLVPALFYGGYLQAAYRLWHHDDYTLTPFVRYEILNTAAGFGSLPVSAGGVAQPDENIWTLGTSFFVGDGIVFKADYRQYKNDKSPSSIPPGFTRGDSLNLGVGYSF